MTCLGTCWSRSATGKRYRRIVRPACRTRRGGGGGEQKRCQSDAQTACGQRRLLLGKSALTSEGSRASNQASFRHARTLANGSATGADGPFYARQRGPTQGRPPPSLRGTARELPRCARKEETAMSPARQRSHASYGAILTGLGGMTTLRKSFVNDGTEGAAASGGRRSLTKLFRRVRVGRSL